MVKKISIFLLLTIVCTLSLAFIYTIFLYNTQNETAINIITLIIGIIFYFLIGIATRIISNKKNLIIAFLGYLILTLIIYVIKVLMLKDEPLFILYKQFLYLLSTLFGTILLKKKKV